MESFDDKMRKILCLLAIFSSNVLVTNASSVSNVRLVDHFSYITSIIQKTMNRVENNSWCNLKLDDIYMNISENVLGVTMSGDVEFTNGFLISLQKLDIIQNTVQQSWVPIRGNTTSVEVHATMRMLDLAVGFDVVSKMNEREYRTTGVMRYPEIRFPFVISKHLFTGVITVRVSSTLWKTSSLMKFSPENHVTHVISALFNWNITAESFRGWATNVFAPITLDLAENEIEFPRICYNCPVTR